ncbi:uncharacterized protein M6B38_360125 [Iris pallida]|uniref:Uncharacterized protein n=1 Tax=Iris pallida TaxID=29817 RepID=A0AAX6GLH7_IRIPA|nr:uncharacterized protein M6B38_360125 [Iris pallida]
MIRKTAETFGIITQEVPRLSINEKNLGFVFEALPMQPFEPKFVIEDNLHFFPKVGQIMKQAQFVLTYCIVLIIQY